MNSSTSELPSNWWDYDRTAQDYIDKYGTEKKFLVIDNKIYIDSKLASDKELRESGFVDERGKLTISNNFPWIVDIDGNVNKNEEPLDIPDEELETSRFDNIGNIIELAREKVKNMSL